MPLKSLLIVCLIFFILSVCQSTSEISEVKPSSEIISGSKIDTKNPPPDLDPPADAPPFDEIPPVTKITPDGGSFQVTQEITLECSDNADCKEMALTFDGNEPVFDWKKNPVINESIYKFNISEVGNGSFTILYRSRDKANNKENIKKASFIIDDGIPEINTISNTHDYISGSYGYPNTYLKWKSNRNGRYYIKINESCNIDTLEKKFVNLLNIAKNLMGFSTVVIKPSLKNSPAKKPDYSEQNNLNQIIPIPEEENDFDSNSTGLNSAGGVFPGIPVITEIKASDLSIGENDINICVEDGLSGLIGEKNYKLIRDDDPPSLTLINPSNIDEVDPGVNEIKFEISEPLQNPPTGELVIKAWDENEYVEIPITSNHYYDNDSRFWIFHEFSSILLPEYSELKIELNVTDTSDLAGNELTDSEYIFKTAGWEKQYLVIDTGQKKCYYANGSRVDCSEEPGVGQDGYYTGVPLSRSISNPVKHSEYDDYVTVDNITGLFWRSCYEARDSADCLIGEPFYFTWYDAFNQCSELNSKNNGAGYYGRKNWRLPTIKELETIPIYNRNSPAVLTKKFPYHPFDFFWSSSTYAKHPEYVWLVNFENGYSTYNYQYGINNDPFLEQDYYNQKLQYRHVRCVSSETEPKDINFVDNDDGTVSDKVTGLRWQKCTRGLSSSDCSNGNDVNKTWVNSISYCENLTLGDTTFVNRENWRMPNINELKSIVYRFGLPPSTYKDAFPNTFSQPYWSSTSSNNGFDLNQQSKAITINFLRGGMWDFSKSSITNVRCVASE